MDEKKRQRKVKEKELDYRYQYSKRALRSAAIRSGSDPDEQKNNNASESRNNNARKSLDLVPPDIFDQICRYKESTRASKCTRRRRHLWFRNKCEKCASQSEPLLRGQFPDQLPDSDSLPVPVRCEIDRGIDDDAFEADNHSESE